MVSQTQTVRKLGTILSDALLKACLEPERNPRPGLPVRKRLQKVVDALVTRAENGDIQATQLIFDRLEGKAVQPMQLDGEPRLTVSIGGVILRADMTLQVRDEAPAQQEALPEPPPHAIEALSAAVIAPGETLDDARARVMAALDAREVSK